MARSTFPTQKCKKQTGSEHLWTFRCRFAWQAQRIAHLVESKQNVRVLCQFQLQPPLHYITLHSTPLHYTTTKLPPQLQLELQLQPTTTSTLHYITLHYATLLVLHYTTLHYTTLPYATLRYATLHYTTLHFTPLHFTTLHYTQLHYNYNCNYD